MPRPFWKGVLSFGLVEMEVTLQPSRAPEELSFTLLDKEDFAPVGYKRYNKRSGDEVPWNRVVRGYEYEPDQYVVLTDEELARTKADAGQTIEVQSFVARDEIDPIYFETPYFVLPRRTGSRGYALLRDTLLETGMVGIARVVLRTREHIAALLVHDNVLMLNTLRYPEQIRPTAGLEAPAEEARGKDSGLARNGRAGGKGRRRKDEAEEEVPAKQLAAHPSAAELRMATRLVEEMREKWDPAKFHDEYRREVMALVEKKVKAGKTHEIVVERTTAEPKARREVVDLMPLLQQSLRKRGRPAAEPRARAPRREPARRRRA